MTSISELHLFGPKCLILKTIDGKSIVKFKGCNNIVSDKKPEGYVRPDHIIA